MAAGTYKILDGNLAAQYFLTDSGTGLIGDAFVPRVALDPSQVVALGQATKANSQPVTMASDQVSAVKKATTITSTTAETTIVTADASFKLDLYGLYISNKSATAVQVLIKDATGAGTNNFTIHVPAGDMRGFTTTPEAGVPQTTANNNWTATSSAAVDSLYFLTLCNKRA